MKIFVKDVPDDLPEECVIIDEAPICSHCGRLDAFDPIFCMGEFYQYCFACASVGGDLSLTRKEKEKIFNAVINSKKDYLNEAIERVKELKIEEVIPKEL